MSQIKLQNNLLKVYGGYLVFNVKVCMDLCSTLSNTTLLLYGNGLLIAMDFSEIHHVDNNAGVFYHMQRILSTSLHLYPSISTLKQWCGVCSVLFP